MVNVADTTVTLKEKIKILGVTLDNHLQWIVKSGKFVGLFYHICALRHIRPVITDEVAKTITCSFVTSHLDYATQCCMESIRL